MASELVFIVLTAPMGKVVKMIDHSECKDKIFLVVISTVNHNVTLAGIIYLQ